MKPSHIEHIGIAVSNIEEQLKKAAGQGVRLTDSGPGKGEGLDITFLHPGSTSGVLIEICEDKSR